MANSKEDLLDLGGLKVSPLGVGTWAWGDQLFWGYEKSMDDELQQVFNACTEQGINLFDTAEVYGFGRSELLCGRFKRESAAAGQRDIALASKFAALPWRLGAQSVVDACKASLDRMGLPSMELYQIHWPGAWQNEAYWQGLADCVDQGLVKAVGVSNYGERQLRQAHGALKSRGVQLASNQIQYSLLHRTPESNGQLRVCQELGVKVLAYSPLAQGVLTGKYSAQSLPSGPRQRIFRNVLEGAQPLLEVLQDIATQREKTPAQVSLNWCITKGTIPIPGAKNVRQAQDNGGALGWRLSREEVSRLDTAAREAKGQMPGMPLAT